MRRWSPSTETSPIRGDRGSAALEFIVVGLLMLVPLVALITALGAIQGQSLGVEAGARHLARTIATAASAEEGRIRAERVLDAVTAEYGLDSADVEIRCLPASGACPQAGATVIVTVRARVALPFAPPLFGLDRLAAVPVEATAVQKVSRGWAEP